MTWKACESFPSIDIRALYQQGKIPPRRSHITLNLGSASTRVGLERTGLPLGGTRPWFKCHCGTRVAVLYCVEGRIACRHCHSLRYASTIERLDRDRLARKLAKLRARVGTSKPKWVRWPTYKRQLERLAAAEVAYSAALTRIRRA